MDITWDLFVNALLSGLLLGGFYAATAVGITIAFGMLDIANIAHPAFMMLGAFLAYYFNTWLGVDPLIVTLVVMPFAFLLGRCVYKLYYQAFERRSDESLQGLAFFFGVLFIVEVGLLLVFGVGYRFVTAPYIGPSIGMGPISVPMRMVVPLLVGVGLVISVQVFLSRTFMGRAILAVAQDREALRLVGVDPIWIKEIAFGIALATAVAAGALLIIIQPVEPSVGRDFIGRVFAICVLGGMTSLGGTVLASAIVGVAESFTSTFAGPSWAPAVSFGLLIITLAIRPSGIFGR